MSESVVNAGTTLVEESAWEMKQRLRRKASEKLGAPLLPLNVFVSEYLPSRITDHMVREALEEEFDDPQLLQSVEIYEYEVSPTFYSKVTTSGIPFDPQPMRHGLTLVKIWYYIRTT